MRESLINEIKRVKKLRKEYVGLGSFGLQSVDVAIQKAEDAIEKNDIVEMIHAYDVIKIVQ